MNSSGNTSSCKRSVVGGASTNYSMGSLLDIFIMPLLSNLGIYQPRDLTYGRYLMEVSPDEIKLEADPEIKTTSRRVFLEKNGKGENIHLKQGELDSAKGKEWIHYKIWEKGSGNNCDVVMLHGKSPFNWFCCHDEIKKNTTGMNDYTG